jgi:hypothetical protein
MKAFVIAVLLIAVCSVCAVGIALTDQFWKVERENTLFKNDVWIDGTVTHDGPQTIAWTSVDLTSPTKTFSVAATSYVKLTSNANQTTCYPTGGALGQLLFLRTGAGSNTIRIDDGTSMGLSGSNVTLTESQHDYLSLICVSADGDEWAKWPTGDND